MHLHSSNTYPMLTIRITTFEEMHMIVSYLTTQSIPATHTSVEHKALIRRCKSLEVHLGSFYLRKENGVLLRVFGEYEKELKLAAIANRHEQLGHFRRDKLLNDLKDRIYAVKREEVEAVLNTCTTCNFATRLQARPALRQITATRVAERFQADLVDLRSYAIFNDDFCWILNVIYVYSKILISIPLKSKSANEVCNAFKNILNLYGEPAILQADNGKEFKNKVIDQYCADFRITRMYSRARYPQTNGQIVRCNQTLKRLLSSLSQRNSERNVRWVDCHSDAVSAYNRTMHRSHSKQPFEVFFRR
ncbi:hypothetical protein ENBRE01_3262, partial [Enteropsectra breve]